MGGVVKTKLGLLQRDAAEIVVRELPWHAYPAMILGYCLMLVIALVVLFVLIDVLTERRWLRKADPDIPDFMQNEHFSRNHTAALSISEMRAVETNHPCLQSVPSKAPDRRESEQPRRSGGGDTREGA